jgi:hypothetical protein
MRCEPWDAFELALCFALLRFALPAAWALSRERPVPERDVWGVIVSAAALATYWNTAGILR